MPRGRKQDEQLREERRREILEAAVQLFAREGFADTGITQVAKAAGLSHGTVFLYFPTKEALFEAAVLEQLSHAEREFHECLSRPGTPLERITRTVRMQIAYVGARESYLRLTQHVIGLRDRFPQLAGELFDYAHRLRSTVMPVIVEGQAVGELAPGDPGWIASTYFAFLNGAGLVFLLPPGHPEWERAVEYGMRIFGPLKPIPGGV